MTATGTGPAITAVLFDFAGVLTSSPWGAMTAAGGRDLELLTGSFHVVDPDETLAELDALLGSRS